MFLQRDKLVSLFRPYVEAHPLNESWRRMALVAATLFVFACGVRALSWHDTRFEVSKVQTAVTGDYKRIARLFVDDGWPSFFVRSSPFGDLNTMGHPPGYPILLAVIFQLFGETDAAVQFFQIILDACCVCLIFLLAIELLPLGVGLIAAVLVAVAPQFTWNVVVVLPDTLAVPPLLLSVYLIVRSRRHPRLAMLLLAGAFVGLSCWLRANALLLVLFLALLVPILFERGRRRRAAAALVLGAIFMIAPLTLRNAIVFRRFIPLSLGAGQTLLEGIADYDREGRFGIPATDLGITTQEAIIHNRPEWAGILFGAEGVERERMRLRRGFGVIAAHPLWFSGVMIRRAASMLRLERARLIAPDPPVTHPIEALEMMPPTSIVAPAQLVDAGTLAAPQTQVALAPDGQTLELTGDDSKYGDQLTSPPFAVQPEMDYAFTLSVKIERGRMAIGVVGLDSGAHYASTIVETVEGKRAEEQPIQTMRLLFVSRSAERVALKLTNAASTPARPLMRIGTAKLFMLGAASFVWTRLPRAAVRGLQKLFLTAVMLPLALCGGALLGAARRWPTLCVLAIVPFYYFCVQSALHTEYRYVLAIHYFLFVVVAVALYWAGRSLWDEAWEHLRRRAARGAAVPNGN